MGSLEVREMEAFLAVADELHFGRAGERLYLSQSRVSQLLRTLEHRVGAPLVERTSRRVRLTPLGEGFLAELRPAYTALQATMEGVRSAARGVQGLLRIGFQGSSNDRLMAAIAVFHRRYPECSTQLVEVPLADPFGALQRDEVDVAVVLLPIAEEDLVLGQVFSEEPQTLAVASDHPFARRTVLSAEDLAECTLIGVRGPAPHYWRRAQSLDVTPGGRPVPAGPTVGTLAEGLAMVATGQGAMLLCNAAAQEHGRRSVTFIPVTGVESSRLGLVWHRNRETARVTAFAQAVSNSPASLSNIRSILR
ncbi:LysR family transcriptional regulator [Nocardia sp. NPDC050712]|uniref:LysR family transcriptional regulator n=1 Tax=Nocardia sp. NPDC050712 TaxID=3155518 RepID=UPI0033DCC9DE